MIQLFLNNTEVFPERDTSIKMIRENPILTESGSYTLDVNLPLSITENVKFFGNLNRIEVSKEYQRYDCELRTNGRSLLVGTTVITKVTDQAVTIQILAGNSNVRFWNNAEEVYIDGYDFNDEDGNDIVMSWLNQFNIVDTTPDLEYGKQYLVRMETSHKAGGMTIMDYPRYRGVPGKFCFPMVVDEDYSGETDDSTVNNVFILEEMVKPLRFYARAVNPNLLYVIRRIVEFRGYSMDFGEYDTEKNRLLHIASARPTLKIADALPHWTVKEFFLEVQKLFNATFVFNDSGKSCSLVSNTKFKDTFILSEIVEEFEGSIDEEGNTGNGIMGSNIWYKNLNDPINIMEKKVLESYTHKMCMNTFQILNDNKRDGDWTIYHIGESRYLTVSPEEVGGQKQIYEVDVFGGLDLGYEKDTELKIIPAKTVLVEVYGHGTFSKTWTNEVPLGMLKDYYGYGNKYRTGNFISVPALSMPNSWKGYGKFAGSLYGKLKGDKDVDEVFGEKEDAMALFFFADKQFEVFESVNRWDNRHALYSYDWSFYREGTMEHTSGVNGNMTDPWGWIVDCPWTDLNVTVNIPEAKAQLPNCSLALREIEGRGSVHGSCFAGMPSLETKVEHKFSFLSPTLPDVRSRFLIRGKLFACKKIEVNVSDDGIDPLLTGYFVEIKS